MFAKWDFYKYFMEGLVLACKFYYRMYVCSYVISFFFASEIQSLMKIVLNNQNL